MKLIDLSHPLLDGAPAFPGDPILTVTQCGRLATHDCNTAQILMGTHQGTHLDAMFHCFDDGRALDRMPLDWFYGPARCLRIPKQPNELITEQDLRRHESFLTRDSKIILNTGWHYQFGKSCFYTDQPSLTVEAARYLAARGLRLLGMDMPSPAQQWVEPHRILLSQEVEMVLVEALANLDALPAEFTFIGFPLNFQGCDGSPIRAVALCL
ncbi:MAG TPA: cyclase family protein [Candidatus Paceibacterota bacterium]|nr:cyclase family protein [Verrucomicrobiota bacterium]HRY46569.1 cyclase family protein [Candidatus Paceibacterota bacterium]